MNTEHVKTGTQITRTSREAAWITAIVLLLIGKYCDRHGITLSTSDSIEIAGGISAAIMYLAAHWKASRIARLADAIGDRLEYKIRAGVNIPDDPANADYGAGAP